MWSLFLDFFDQDCPEAVVSYMSCSFPSILGQGICLSEWFSHHYLLSQLFPCKPLPCFTFLFFPFTKTNKKTIKTGG